MRKHHAVRGRNYELLACVVIIQHEDCLRANVYHKYELKYELVACVSVMQHEGASTSCWRVLSSYSARAACE